MASQSQNNVDVFILCRMLFSERVGTNFRRPWLGESVFLGGTGYDDWPLEPIEIVDGIPFYVIRGYNLAGLAEAPDQYVHYCDTNCDWSEVVYTSKTQQQKRAALHKLFYSLKWKRPLNPDEQYFLSSQIE
jgi:hypothetical protein